MVERSARLDSVFQALSDPTRRGMLATLAVGSRSVGDLAAPYAMSFAAAAKHVGVLERAGLVSREIRGRTHLCRLEPGALAAADDFLAPYRRFWAGRLDALEAALAADGDIDTGEQS